MGSVGMSAYMCAQVGHVENRGRLQVTFPTALYVSPLRQGLSPNLEISGMFGCLVSPGSG